MGAAMRNAALGLLALALLLTVASLFFPWWAVQTGLAGQPPRDEDQYQPFQAKEQGSRQGQLDAHIGVLGGIVVAAGLLLLAAIVRAARPPRGAGLLRLLAFGAMTAALLAVLFTVFAFPAAAQGVHGVDIAFQGQSCTSTTALCFRTGPLIGWWFGIAGTVTAFAAAVLPKTSGEPERAEVLPEPRPVPAASLPPRVVAAEAPARRAEAPKVGGTGVKVVKCPQCQTRLGFARTGPPQLVPCPNCGLRVAI